LEADDRQDKQPVPSRHSSSVAAMTTGLFSFARAAGFAGKR